MTQGISERNERARALTVFQSPKIERFDIELIGDLPDGGIAGIDLILGRAFGPKIDELGGVPAGASGSPVYVGERLIGAVGYSFAPDYRLVGITPIEAMRRLAFEPGPRSGPRSPGRREEKEDEDGSDREGESAPDRIVWPLGLAPAIGGFRSQRSLHLLKERLAIEAVPVPGPVAVQALARPIGPGSPFGIPLIDGDIRLGAIGTVTSVEGDKVLGLGHPAFFAGAVRLPLNEATIVTTAGGLGPVKVGYIGRNIGVITQDRSAGVFGEIGRLPETVELTMEIIDTDRHVQERVRVELVALIDWIPVLTFIATAEAFGRAMNRVGPGEATWTWTVDVADAEEPVREEMTEYSTFDIGGTVAQSGEELLSHLIEEGEVVESIRLDARVRL